MQNLKIRTEYSFRKVFGPIDRVVEAVPTQAVAITDMGSWGHIPFYKACTKAGKKPILGVELPMSTHSERKKQQHNMMTFLPLNNDGLEDVYELIREAYNNFYYVPRLLYNTAIEISQRGNIIVLSGNSPDISQLNDFENIFLEASVANPGWLTKINKVSKQLGIDMLAVNDNYYPYAQDKEIYNLLVERPNTRTAPMHIMSRAELALHMPDIPDKAFHLSDDIAQQVDIKLSHAENVKFPDKTDLKSLCLKGIQHRKIKMTEEYEQRMEHELKLIKEKGFVDYFLVIADMIMHAKRSMLVGPSRGSSAGSLVCYLLGITEIDPLQHGLIFERFIDITREDFPDIDIDFPDIHRESVIQYLRDKYGEEHVAHVGTISRYKPKSAIGDISKALNIPVWECNDVKNTIIERSGGDSRAAFCIQDTFETTEVGKNFIEKYPQMKVVEKIENHARHTGVHAAGIIVCNEPVKKFCGIDPREGTAMLDKYSAEEINILKIDVLGLRTLNVLQSALESVGLDNEYLYNLPLEDEEAFEVFNGMQLSGIFQFEGHSLQSLCRQMGIHSFDDIVAITSLARPGPLHSGGATEFIRRRTGKEKVVYMHKSIEPFTEETYGVVVYQEQVLKISREVGKLSWEDTNQLRKALSKSLGEEFFNKYQMRFVEGAKQNKIDEKDADTIWKNMCTFGSWAFNKSHAVSYGLISYWCAHLKAHHPLEFAVSCLNYARDEDQTIKLLRELVNEGYQYKAFDEQKSQLQWTVQNDVIVGPLTGVKGIGKKTAEQIINKRQKGQDPTPRQQTLLQIGVTPWDDVFETRHRFEEWFADPRKYKITSGPLTEIINIQENGEFVFIGKLKEKNLKDLNEYGNLVKRGGRRIERNSIMLNLVFEDDTDKIICSINRFSYPKIGKPIIEHGKIGDYYLVKGKINNDWRKLQVERLKCIEHV